MSKPISTIANDINDLLRKSGNDCITLKWDQFYTICDRERMAEVVQERVAKELKKRDLHIVYANNVIVVRDFCSYPVTLNG